MPSLGRFIQHTRQWNDKFQVDLQVHTAFGVKNQSPTPHYFVSYKRGDHKGSSMKLASADPHTITFDQTCCFSLPCTLYYSDVTKKDYEEKVLTIFFNEECPDDPIAYIIHGKANIDLAKYAKEVPLNSSKSFPLTEVMSKPKKGEALKLQVTLTLTCVSITDIPTCEPVVESTTPPSSLPSTPIRISSASDLSTPSAPVSIPTSATPISIPTSSTPIQIPISSTPISIPASSTPINIHISSTTPPRMNSAGSIPSITGLASFSAPARSRGDDESVSSFSSRTSPPSSPSSSPSSSPPRFSSSIEEYMHHHRNGSYNSDRGSNSGRRSNRASGSFTPVNGSLPSSASSSYVKSYLQSPPVKMHLLERQASDSLLNIGDIAKRLASKHPELCKSKDGTPIPRVDSVKTTESNSRPSSPHRRALDFKNEGKVKSLSDFKPSSAEAIQKQKEDERFLIEEVIPLPPAYSESKIPVLAYVLFRTLLQWRSFHPINAAFLESFFVAFNSLVDISPTDFTGVILYRLSTAASLLHILRTELKILSADNVGSPVLKDFGRRLKKLLTSFYDLYYSKVKEELDDAIQTLLGNIRDDKASGKLTSVFDQHLKLVQTSICFESLQQQIIYQIFYYFNAKIFNSLLQKTTPCQCAVGLGLKMAIQQVENWAISQKEQSPTHPDVAQLQSSSVKGWVYDLCRRSCHPSRQAADVLVVTKSTLVEPKIRDEVCPSLTPRQLLLLLEQYVPDDFDPEPIHPGVLKAVSEEASGEFKPSYQAEEPVPTIDATQPISIDAHFSQVLSLTSIPIPSVLADNPSFSFLNIVCPDKSNQPW